MYIILVPQSRNYIEHQALLTFIKYHFSCGLATLWTLTIIIPLLGFFVVLADDPIEISDNTIPRKLFQFLPHGMQNDQHVICEITFPKIQIVTDPEFNSVDFEPNTRQKVK